VNRPDLRGLIAAIVTPMHADFSVDQASLRRYARWLVGQGVAGIAVNVDTGEGMHLSPTERISTAEVVLDEVGGRTTVVAGLPAAATETAANAAAQLAALGVDALLVFPHPVYLGEPLDPEIAVRYHAAVAQASGLPLIAFQLQPALGGVNFATDVLAGIMSVEGVVAIKEASFDAKRFVETVRLVSSLPSGAIVLNGNDNFLLEAYLLGAEGALLGFGTLAAAEQIEMHQALRDQNLQKASDLGQRLQTLSDVIFAAPVRDYRARLKYALVQLDVIAEAHVRPPLLPLGQHERERVELALKHAGLR
jgi:4-hydroxy-tetrahydrodipicolinate synthase